MAKSRDNWRERAYDAEAKLTCYRKFVHNCADFLGCKREDTQAINREFELLCHDVKEVTQSCAQHVRECFHWQDVLREAIDVLKAMRGSSWLVAPHKSRLWHEMEEVISYESQLPVREPTNSRLP